ncbi:recombinase family protein [Mucilaginibacter sp.]|uniref:recombinase family protein n=1 Tax=Mucilaginibacter sp. TaxID=1882438 RepID=UPI003D0FC17C
MAIDQPIDFSIPESTVMLAVYLSIPEAENTRRALNVMTGMRRAKLAGRWMATAPKGYINLSHPDGRKSIAPKEPEATFMRQAFEEIAKGVYHADQVRKLINERVFDCSKQNFWRLIRNPVYCGIIVVAPYDGEEIKFVKAMHEPLIYESLFYEVQDIINGNNRKTIPTTIKTPDDFPLRGFVRCCKCGKVLTGSVSKGKTARYWYYHCYAGCNVRYPVNKLNQAFETELELFSLNPVAAELFKMIVMDEFNHTNKGGQTDRKQLMQELEEQEQILSSARRKLLKDVIDEADYKAIKKECADKIARLESRLTDLPKRAENRSIDGLMEAFVGRHSNLLQYYRDQDVSMKRHLISSMFSEKMDFDGTLLRTPAVSEPLSLFLLVNKALKGKKIREDLKVFKSSRGVARRGIEHLYSEKI